MLPCPPGRGVFCPLRPAMRPRPNSCPTTIHRTKALPPGLQRYTPPSGWEVASPPGEDGGRVTKDRISLPPGLQRYKPPSGREVASPPGEDGGRVTKDRISLPQSFATQNPAPSSEGANTAVQTRRRHPVGGRVAEPGEYSISMIAGGNHTLIPNQPPASADPNRRKREADCLP